MQTCNLVNNSDYNYFASTCSDPGTVINAEFNWWGTADAAEIEETIYHRVDYASSPTVDFVPFAEDPFRCDCTGFCDVNLDGAINPVDVVFIVNYVYKNIDSLEPISTCSKDNGDWNCDGETNPVDVVSFVNFVYKSQGDGPCSPCAE